MSPMLERFLDESPQVGHFTQFRVQNVEQVHRIPAPERDQHSAPSHLQTTLAVAKTHHERDGSQEQHAVTSKGREQDVARTEPWTKDKPT